VVLFDATRRQPAPRDFGRGILRSLPTARRTWTSQDEAWAARELNDRPTAYDRHVDTLAALAATQDRLERGCLL
jgi:hypothetical protein